MKILNILPFLKTERKLKFINTLFGTALLFIGIFCFCFPDLFFHELYNISFSTPQSKTELRVLSSLTISQGILFLFKVNDDGNQKTNVIYALTILIVIITARILGLIIDGKEQIITYYELSFEAMIFLLYLKIYFEINTTTSIAE